MRHLNKIKTAFTVGVFLILYTITTQIMVACGGPGLTLAQKAAQANYIFEAEVVDIQYFHHEEEPYTVHYLSIYKVFKGELPDTVELISYGGKTNHPQHGQVFVTEGNHFHGSKEAVSIFFTVNSDINNPNTKKPDFNLKFPNRYGRYTWGSYPEHAREKLSELGQVRCHKRLEKNYYKPLQKILTKEYIEKKAFLKKKL